LNRLSAADQRALRFGGIGVIAVLVFMLVASPLKDYWDGLNNEIAREQRKLTAIQTGLEDAASGKVTLEKLRKTARIHKNRAELNAQTARVRQQIEALPSYAELTVVRLEDMPVRAEDDYYRSSISLQFSGKLGSVHHFLQQAAAAKPALKVDRMTLAGAQSDVTRVEGQMVISGYGVLAAEDETRAQQASTQRGGRG
jgi:hypothetical protein